LTTVNTTDGKLDLQDAEAVCRVLREATEANLTSTLRRGATVELSDEGRLVVTGDMHDHRLNYRKAVRLAALEKDAGHHLLLQELIHSERLINGRDLSYRLSVETAQMQLQYPGRVHVLLSNHELSQAMGEDILKHGISSTEAFLAGLEYVFDEDAERVHEALSDWIKSLPLAVRCANGVFCAHSLPAPRKRPVFDPNVISRQPTEPDLTGPNGSAHLLVWGRNLAQEWADDLASQWGAALFVLGHQPAEMGYEFCGETMLILASDHEHGVALPIDLSASYTQSTLADQIIPFAAMAD